MNVTTAQLYDLLIEKGFEKDRVREALSQIASREEVEKIAATGFDRVRAEFRNDLRELEMRMYRAMLVQTATIAAIVLGMLQFAA
jgi:SOS response regulatory protein OraA/RecX